MVDCLRDFAKTGSRWGYNGRCLYADRRGIVPRALADAEARFADVCSEDALSPDLVADVPTVASIAGDLRQNLHWAVYGNEDPLELASHESEAQCQIAREDRTLHGGLCGVRQLRRTGACVRVAGTATPPTTARTTAAAAAATASRRQPRSATTAT